MLFSDVTGQATAKSGLINLYNTGHLPHALLFTGKEGTGGLPLVIAFAQYIFCEQKNELDACGQCPGCVKVAKLAHPDLHFTFPAIAPKPGTKPLSRLFIQEFREFIAQNPYGTTYDWLQFINAENKQGNIPAEECREMIERLNMKSYESGYKIQIIWRPEYLGKEGNILLKLIEEPPADTLIFMVAEEPEKMLATILSRTQQVRLLPLTTTEIADALINKRQVDARKAAQVAQLADGSYTYALELLQHAGNDMLPEIKEWFESIMGNNGMAINKWVEDMAKLGREQQKNFLQFAQQLLGHALRIGLIPAYEPPLPADELSFTRNLAQKGFTPQAFRLMNDSISKTIYHIERNAHSKTQLLYLSIQMQYHIKERSLQPYA
jgi:DNA polymerase-3 subunit delta'